MTETNYNKLRDSLVRLQERYKDYLEIIPDFIKEAISLYETISGVKWQN